MSYDSIPLAEGKDSVDNLSINFNFSSNHAREVWDPRSKAWPRFIDLLFSKHPQGTGFVPATLIGGRRDRRAVQAVHAIVLNVQGVALNFLQEGLELSGWAGAVVTTADNNRVDTMLNHDMVVRCLTKIGAGKDDANGVGLYLESIGWSDDLVASVEIVEARRATPDGAMIVIRHDPLPAYMVAIPLDPPYVPTTAAASHDAGLKLFGEVIASVAYQVGGAVQFERVMASRDLRDPARSIALPNPSGGLIGAVVGGDALDWRTLGVEEVVPVKMATPQGKPTFEGVKAMIYDLPPKNETPDPEPVLKAIAQVENQTHRDALLDALKRRTGISIASLRADIRARRRAAGEGPEVGVRVDKDSGFRTLMHTGEPDHRQARAFLVNTMVVANKAMNDPLFTLNLGQVMALRRHDGRAAFTGLSSRQLQAELFKHCAFAAYREGSDLIHRIPDSDVVGVVLEGLEPGELPTQPRIRRAPSIGRDGRILAANGWHGDVLVDLGELTAPVVPIAPTRAEIDAALDLILTDVLGDFPFDDGGNQGGDASRANAVALLLTPFMRDAFYGPSPLFCIVKPGAGMGGTLLAETAQILSDGRTTAPTPNARSEEEAQKLLVSAIMSDASFLCFDNVVSLISETMKRSITAETLGGRVLGRSELVERPNDFTWIATGINPRLGAEMTRRACFINLNTRAEFSGKRVYRHPDFKGWLKDNRSRVIGALLTLARAWFDEGGEPSDDRLDSFRSWSSTLGGVLKTAGVKGFLQNPRAVAGGEDREAAEVKAFMTAWWLKWSGEDVTERAAMDYAETLESDLLTGRTDERRRWFGQTLDALLGRVFDLGPDRVMFGVGQTGGWRLVRIGATA